MSVKQSIKVTNAGLSPILSVAQGTGAIEYEFTVSDFDIPSGSAAVAYNIQPTGNIVSQTCSISGNTITVKPPAYYFLRGKNYMQFQVSRSNEDLFSFLIEVWCAPNISQPEVIVAENPSLVSQLISDVGLLSSQLDNLLSIPSGSLSTSADAALADIKVGWDGTTYDTPGDAVRGQIGSLSEEIVDTNNVLSNISHSLEKTESEGTYFYNFEMTTGHTYLVKNTSENKSASLNLFTSDGSENIETVANNLISGNFIRFTPTVNSNMLKMYANSNVTLKVVDESSIVESLTEISMRNMFGTLHLEQGGIYSSNGLNAEGMANRVRTKNYLNGDFYVKTPMDIMIYGVFYYDKYTLEFDSFVEVNTNEYYVGKDGCVSRISFSKENSTENIYVSDLKLEESVESVTVSAKDNSTNFVPFNFKKGKCYRISVDASVSSQINAWTYSTKTDSGKVQCVVKNLSGGNSVDFIPLHNATYLRFYTNKNSNVSVREIDVCEKYPPIVNLFTDTTLRNVSEDMTLIDYSEDGQTNMLGQFTTLFDGLVQKHSSYVTKYDCAEYVGLEYPSYADYNTFLYRFNDISQSLGEISSSHKKKLLIVAGTHGNEIATTFTLYLFMRDLCDRFLENDNFYKFRGAFDIYVIPCLNGYGIKHLTRANGNKVNINRNYPIKKWAVSGYDTIDNGLNQYTGPEAGSEFETKLVMEVTKKIEPHMAIDFHNYSSLEQQFYTIISRYDLLHLVRQSAVDCFIAFKKGLSQYFGNTYGGINTNADEAPTRVAKDTEGMTSRWWYEYGIPFSATIEVSQGINYLNGEYVATIQDNFGADSFSVAEFTFRNQMMRYAQYVLDN